MATRRDLMKAGLAAGVAGLIGGKREPEIHAQTQQAASPARWQEPPAQKGNNLNLIVLVSDTFRADNLKAYGSQWVDTPYLNSFAEDSILFESAYPEGMP